MQVKEIRKYRNLKQSDVAKFLGMSLPNYNKKENGNVRFSLEEAKKLSELFLVSIEKIFS